MSVLLSSAYVPTEGEAEKLVVLGQSVGDLVSTIDHNLQNPLASRLQLSVGYDNLPGEPLAAFRTASAEKALALLRELDSELSTLDRDTNPESAGSGQYRAGVTIYYFEENLGAGRQ